MPLLNYTTKVDVYRKTTGGHSFRFLTRDDAEKALEAIKDD